MKTTRKLLGILFLSLTVHALCAIDLSNLQPLASDQVPTRGTFWPASGGPPLPMPPPGADVYDMGNGQYAYDDTTTLFSMSLESPSVPMPGDGPSGTNSEPQDPDPGTNCMCCSYPTNGVMKWYLQMSARPLDSVPSMGADGTIYFPSPTCEVGSDPDNSPNRLTAIDPTLVDTNNESYPDPTPSTKWFRSLAGCGAGMTPTVGQDGTIYINSSAVTFSAFSPTDGSPLWKFWLPSDVFGGSDCQPAIGQDGTIYLTSGFRVFAITNAPGMTNFYSNTNYTFGLTNVGIKWMYPTGTVSGSSAPFTYSSPVIGDDGTVYVNMTAGTGNIYAFNPTNGIVKWRTSDPFRATASYPPVIGGDGTIYYGVADTLYAIDPHRAVTNGVMTGFKWTTGAPTQYLPYSLFQTPVIGNGGKMYVKLLPLYNGNGGTNQLLSMNCADGSTNWVVNLGPFADESSWIRGSIALAADGEIYVVDGNTVYSFCPNGTTNWSYLVPGAGTLGSPMIGPDGTLYTANGGRSDSPYLFAFEGPSPVACSPWPEDRKNARRTAQVTPQSLAGHFSSLAMQTNGFAYTLAAPTNTIECVCASTDLVTWTNLGQIVLTNGTQNLVDTNASAFKARFYMAKPQ